MPVGGLPVPWVPVNRALVVAGGGGLGSCLEFVVGAVCVCCRRGCMLCGCPPLTAVVDRPWRPLTSRGLQVAPCWVMPDFVGKGHGECPLGGGPVSGLPLPSPGVGWCLLGQEWWYPPLFVRPRLCTRRLWGLFRGTHGLFGRRDGGWAAVPAGDSICGFPP